MINRYRTKIADLWDPAWTSEVYKKIQVSAAEFSSAVPDAALHAMSATHSPTLPDWQQEERRTGHDVAAWVNVYARNVDVTMPGMGKWVHYGLTSSDLVDTANALRYVTALGVIDKSLRSLCEELRDQVQDHEETRRIGRTHGQNAEPTTWGHQLSVYADQLEFSRGKLWQQLPDMRKGKLSGAVGRNGTLSVEAEVYALSSLGLNRVASTQIVPRDGIARIVTEFAVVASIVENLATEIRLGTQAAIGEFTEGGRWQWGESQVGSSSMPHKTNPITCEKLCGLARMQRSYVGPVLETLGALWGDRDISNSSVERLAVPDAFMNLDYMVTTVTDVLARLYVNADEMSANLLKAGVEAKSGELMRALIRNGAAGTRQQGWRWARHASKVAFTEGITLWQATFAVAAEDGYLQSPAEAVKSTRDFARLQVDRISTALAEIGENGPEGEDATPAAEGDEGRESD